MRTLSINVEIASYSRWPHQRRSIFEVEEIHDLADRYLLYPPTREAMIDRLALRLSSVRGVGQSPRIQRGWNIGKQRLKLGCKNISMLLPRVVVDHGWIIRCVDSHCHLTPGASRVEIRKSTNDEKEKVVSQSIETRITYRRTQALNHRQGEALSPSENFARLGV